MRLNELTDWLLVNVCDGLIDFPKEKTKESYSKLAFCFDCNLKNNLLTKE